MSDAVDAERGSIRATWGADYSVLIATVGFLIVLLFAMPASPWEFDEPLFFQALHKYDPVAHHPPPPGYPVFIFTAKLFRFFIPSDFAALVTVSVLASTMAFALLALAFGRIAGDRVAGLAGAILFYLSPTMLLHSTLPISEPGALALFAAALYFGSAVARLRGSEVPPAQPRNPATSQPVLFALFSALTVGWRIQFAIFVVPFFLVAVAMMPRWRDRFIALGTFTVVCLIWLTPLTIAVGGVDKLIAFETRQAQYLAAQDADQSRTGWTPAGVAARFIAHPWGTKITSVPLLLLAIIGLRRVRREFIPLGAGAAIYIAFALWNMDPADGARYSIPFMVCIAFLAGVGAARFPRPYLIAAAFAVSSIIYVSSVVSQRSTVASPPVRAAQFAKHTYPANAVTLYELPLWPHATYYLSDRNPRRIDAGLAADLDHPDVPLFMYADGSAETGKTFRWWPSDAYTKLTRNHYRVVSIIPVTNRFKVLRGVFTPEREAEGRGWRWISDAGEMQLGKGPERSVWFTFGLPVRYPFETNELTISVDGRIVRVVRLERNHDAIVTIAVPAGSPVIGFRAARSFVPAEIPGSLNRDRRRLSVKMYAVRIEAFDSRAERQAASR